MGHWLGRACEAQLPPPAPARTSIPRYPSPPPAATEVSGEGLAALGGQPGALWESLLPVMDGGPHTDVRGKTGGSSSFQGECRRPAPGFKAAFCSRLGRQK